MLRGLLVVVLALVSQICFASLYKLHPQPDKRSFRYAGFPVEVLASPKPASENILTDGKIKVTVPDGKGGQFVCGDFSNIQGVQRKFLAHLRADNSVNPDWNPDPDGAVDSLVLNGDNLIVTGKFNHIAGVARKGMASLTSTSGEILPWSPSVSGNILCLAISGQTAYIGGYISRVGNVPRVGLAAVDMTTGQATSWNPTLGYSQNFTPQITSMVIHNNLIYISGYFDSVGGTPRKNFAAIDLITGQPTSWNPNSSFDENLFPGIWPGPASSMFINGNTLYVGGSFGFAGGARRSKIAALDLTTGLATNWNPGSNGGIRKLFLNGNKLFVGGNFTIINGQPRHNTAQFELSTGLLTNWNPNVDGTVHDFALYGNSIFLVGDFDVVGGVQRDDIALVDTISGTLNLWKAKMTDTIVHKFKAPDNCFYSVVTRGNVVYLTGSRKVNLRWRSSPEYEADLYQLLVSFDARTGDATTWMQSPSPEYGISGEVALCNVIRNDTMFIAGTFYRWRRSGDYSYNLAAATFDSVCNLANSPVIQKSGSTDLCGGGSVTLSLPTYAKYRWSTGDTTQSITVSSAGSYTAQYITNTINGCTSAVSLPVVVTVGSIPSTTVIVPSGPTTLCGGSSVTLSAPSGFRYRWSTGDTTQSITVDTAGSFTVQTIAGSCSSAISLPVAVTVAGSTTTPVIATSGSTTLCTGNTVTLSAPSGFRYRWSSGDTTQTITVDTAGSFTVQTIVGSCTSAVSAATVVTVTPPLATPVITASGSIALCPGNSVTLSAPAGFRYRWSTGDTTQTITVDTAGSFTVQTIAGTCSSAASAATVVTVTPPLATPVITASGSTALCPGNSVTLSALSGFRYRWSTGDTTQSITVDTTGSFTVQTIAGTCSSAASAATVVTVTPPLATPVITASGSTALCPGNSVTLSALSGFRYRWSTGDTTQSITVDTAGSFTVQTIAGSCTSAISAATVVTVTPPLATPVIIPSGPTTFFVGDSVLLIAPVGFAYVWSSGETTDRITVKSAGSYTVRTISNGCTSAVSAPVVVIVNTPPANVWIWNGTGTYDQVSLWDRNSVPPITADSIVIASGVCTVPLDLEMGHVFVAAGARLVVNGSLTNQLLNAQGTVEAATINQRQGIAIIRGGGQVSCSTYVNTGAMGTTINNSRLTVNKLTLGSNLSLTGPNAVVKVAHTSTGEQGVQFAGGQIIQELASQFVAEASFSLSHTTTGGGAWANVGPPIQNYLVSDLAANNQFADSTFNNTVAGGSSLYLYDPSNTTWPTNEGYVKAPNASYTLAANEGVRVWLRNSMTGPLQFRGYPFQADQVFNLSYCASNCAYESPNGFNLVKNPFPTALDWANAAIGRNNVESGIWIWRDSAQVFSTYTGGIGINGGRSAVALGQAFFVRAYGSGASLALPVSATTTTNVNPFRTSSIDNLIRLNVMEGANSKDEAAIRFNATSTPGFDPALDASKLSGPGVDISTLLPSGRKLSINNLPMVGITRVPVLISRISSTTAQTLRISLENIDTGTVVLLSHPSFSNPMIVSNGFTLPLTTALGQGLELIAGPRILSMARNLTPTLTLRPNPATTSVQLHLTAGSFKGVSILDQLGRTVLTTTTLNGDLLDISTLAAGTYVVKVSTESGVATQRLAVVR